MVYRTKFVKITYSYMKGVGLKWKNQKKSVVVRRPISHSEKVLGGMMLNALNETIVDIHLMAEHLGSEARDGMLEALMVFMHEKQEEISNVLGFNSWEDMITYIDQGFDM